MQQGGICRKRLNMSIRKHCWKLPLNASRQIYFNQSNQNELIDYVRKTYGDELNFYGKSFRKMQFGGGRIQKNGTVYY